MKKKPFRLAFGEEDASGILWLNELISKWGFSIEGSQIFDHLVQVAGRVMLKDHLSGEILLDKKGARSFYRWCLKVSIKCAICRKQIPPGWIIKFLEHLRPLALTQKELAETWMRVNELKSRLILSMGKVNLGDEAMLNLAVSAFKKSWR